MITGKVFDSKTVQQYIFLRFLANLLRSIWLFFPSILFIVLALICFTQLSQGKDIIISFTETTGTFGGILLSKLIFIIAIIFWVYVSWYASRIVAYIKEFKHKQFVFQLNGAITAEDYDNRFAMEQRFLQRFPRIIGYACLLVVIYALAILLIDNKWIIRHPFILLTFGLIIVWQIDRQVIRLSSAGKIHLSIERLLQVFGFMLPVLLIAYVVAALFRKIPFILLLMLVLLVFFMLYINLRRQRMNKLAEKNSVGDLVVPVGFINLVILRLMLFFHLPKEEKNYFIAFNVICLFGLAAYVFAIFSLPASVRFGPFAFVLLAFSVLMGFGNIIAAISCKYGINVHFIIFSFAALLPTPDNHRVRTVALSQRHIAPDIYKKRQDATEYFTRWVLSRPEIDSFSAYPMYIVLANGGASRSAYWAASVLGRLQDASVQKGKTPFSRQLFCLSGSSGGGVGIASFYAMLLQQQNTAGSFEKSARNFLQQDFLTFTLARMLGPDFFNYIPLINLITPKQDRAEALEQAFEKADDRGDYLINFDSTYFDACIATKGITAVMPILFINTTRVKDGNPGVISSIQLPADAFNRRVDVLDLLLPNQSIRLSTAAILGARFPFISPAGRIDSHKSLVSSAKNNNDSLSAHYFVDGGYFDNSGAGVVQELMRQMLQATASVKDSVFIKRCKKLSIVILHITNGPQVGGVVQHPMGPFVNDLLAPGLTILGAFDMQTTVNDRRLMNFIKDIRLRSTQFGINSANYLPLHLYNDPDFLADTLSNGPYAMNWFISDSVRHQMDQRLNHQPRLQLLLSSGTEPH
jgi:hypothetical protein